MRDFRAVCVQNSFEDLHVQLARSPISSRPIQGVEEREGTLQWKPLRAGESARLQLCIRTSFADGTLPMPIQIYPKSLKCLVIF